jgi:hypothetical protein
MEPLAAVTAHGDGGAGAPGSPPARGLRHWWPVALLALALGAYVSLAGLQWWIQGEAHKVAAISMRAHAGDEVTALTAFVTSETHGLDERNDAVWALGQLADPRALPGLEQFHTGEPCDHATSLCQYELEKAIARCRGCNQPPCWLPLFPHRRHTTPPSSSP